MRANPCSRRSTARARWSCARFSHRFANRLRIGWLTGVIDKLLAKNPADQIQSAAEVAELLERCLAHLQQPSLVPAPFEVPAPLVRRTRANRRRWAMPAALLVVGFSCLGLAEATGVTQITAAILRLAIGEGTLAVEVDDPALRVRIDGQEVTLGVRASTSSRLAPANTGST